MVATFGSLPAALVMHARSSTESPCAQHAWLNANRRQHMINGLTVAGLSDTGARLKRALSMEDFDLSQSFDELLKPTDPSKEAALEDTTEVPDITSLESILLRLPPEGQAWFNGLDAYCRRAVEHDLRAYGPDLFVKYWGTLRDTLQKLERDLGPSDNWK